MTTHTVYFTFFLAQIYYYQVHQHVYTVNILCGVCLRYLNTADSILCKLAHFYYTEQLHRYVQLFVQPVHIIASSFVAEW